MSRVLAVVLALAIGAPAGALAIGAPAAALADPGQHASLSAFACRQAQDPLNRVIAVTATIRPLPGTLRMALRFSLMQRLPGQRPHPVHGGDLGRWRAYSVRPWAVTKPVANLPGPAVYRFRIGFRWLGPSGRVIAAQTLLSPTCSQPQ
jgi:hypothetical protein